MHRDILKRIDALAAKRPKYPGIVRQFAKCCTTDELRLLAVDIPLPGKDWEPGAEAHLNSNIERLAAKYGFNADDF